MNSLFGFVEKKYNAQQEKQMVVTAYHMLGAKVGEGQKVYARRFKYVAFITRSYRMCENRIYRQSSKYYDQHEGQARPRKRVGR